MHFLDVFNGDADGICSLIQLRRENPVESKLFTGVKRDIKLLRGITNIEARNAKVLVLDISYEKNADDVLRLLHQGAFIDYFDHHRTGKVAKHAQLNLTVNLNSDVCTSLLVNNALGSKYVAWALVGAFGDNLNLVAAQLANECTFDELQLSQMQELGSLVNYNSYGDTIEDLHYHPENLFKMMAKYDEPFSFIQENASVLDSLRHGYSSDMANARNAKILYQSDASKVYELPNQKWARRVNGVLSNQLTNHHPDHAIAMVRRKNEGGYVVSLRAPLNNKQGADKVASQFPSGGGRSAAAGINLLPDNLLDMFISAFDEYYR